jgi:hypothetical protein
VSLSPHELRDFIDLPGFTARWDALGLTDADRSALEFEIMADPAAGAVVPTSGGFRKLRFAPPSWGRGKRGALRVYYAHIPGLGVVLLGSVFSKTEKADLSADQRKTLASLVRTFETLYEVWRRVPSKERRRRMGLPTDR